jgi:DNA repair protein RadA/Sms
MAKIQTEYNCNVCGARSRQHFGKCPSCASWNSLVEQVVAQTPVGPSLARRKPSPKQGEPAPAAAQKLHQIVEFSQARITTGYAEFDRVLGGGIVPGSLVLLGGDPGIGKSTLLLQTATQLAQGHAILYVAAEESGQQVKLRWQRLLGSKAIADGSNLDELSLNKTASTDPKASPKVSPKAAVKKASKQAPDDRPDDDQAPDPRPAGLETGLETPPIWDNLYLLADIDLDGIINELESLRPKVAVIDSIQALYNAALNSAPGSVSQVRECTAALMRVAKQLDIALLIVGHVTKDGAIAGPKVLEHLVDTVLYFEGDRFASHRLLRSVKNRFGATHELGVFEMVAQGLDEVPNPSVLFLGSRNDASPGMATVVACEGTRPLLVEIQALVSPTSYASPRRSATGVESARLLQILAVLEKRVGLPLSKFDAYVASAGGLTVSEPAADLGIAVAVLASFRDRIVDPNLVLIGEIGLGGQVRSVSQVELRLKEAEKLGFTRAIVPKGQAPVSGPIGKLTVLEVSRVVDAIAIALQGSQPDVTDRDLATEFAQDDSANQEAADNRSAQGRDQPPMDFMPDDFAPEDDFAQDDYAPDDYSDMMQPDYGEA